MVSSHLPEELIRKVANRINVNSGQIRFQHVTMLHQFTIFFHHECFVLYDDSRGSSSKFKSIDELLASMRSDTHLRSLLV